MASLENHNSNSDNYFDLQATEAGEGKSLSLQILQFVPEEDVWLEDYLATAGHGADLSGPLFRPVRKNQKQSDPRRHLHPESVDRILRKYAAALGLDSGYSAHSVRATFITTALNNGANLFFATY